MNLTLLTKSDRAGISLKNFSLIALPSLAPLPIIEPVLLSPLPYFIFCKGH